MKVLLTLSILMNAVLAFLLVNREEPAPPPQVESVVLEKPRVATPKPNPDPKPAPCEVTQAHKETPSPVEKPESPEEAPSILAGPMDEGEFDMALEKMEQERANFFFDELNLPPEFLSRYRELRMRHEENMTKLWKGNVEPSFEDREMMLKLEKKYHDELEKLFGEENWKRYKQFRDNFNNRGMKQELEDHRPFIIMQP